MISRQQLRHALRRSKKEPGYWAEEILGINPWDVQVDILNSVRDNFRTYVRSCHGAGKTYLAGAAALWFLTNFKGARVLTTAPTFRQVEKALWQEIRKMHKGANVPLGGELTLTQLKMDDGWFAFGFSTDDPNALQGQHALHMLVILDEASGIAPPIWEGVDSLLTSENSRFLAIGNPTNPIGDFADGFKDPTASKISISAFDTPNFTAFGITKEDCLNENWRKKIDGNPLPVPELVTPFWVADAFRKYGIDSPWCQARVFGKFPVDAEDVLIPLSWVEEAAARSMIPEGDIEIGADISSRGRDETVIYKRNGPVVRLLDSRFPPAGGKISTTRTAKRIQDFMESEGATIAKVDGIGIGVGVVDQLGLLGVPHEDVQFGAGAVDSDRYINFRAEAYWGLRERFDPDNATIDIDPEDEILMAQLSSIRWDEQTGRIRIEGKDKLPKSPDRADALAILFSGGGAEAWGAEMYLIGDRMISAGEA